MDIDNIATLIDAIRAGAAPVLAHETPLRKLFLVPGHGGQAARTIEVSTDVGLTPLRKRGRVVVFDAASFNQVLKDNADAGDIAIYMNRDPACPSVVAVMNGNGQGGPGWGDFRCELEFRQTPQWQKWCGIDGKLMQQVPFAEFLEENMEDVTEPPGAQLLEIATYLSVVRTVHFKAGVKLHDGLVHLQHEESDEVKAGTVKLPEEFKLGIKPMLGLASYVVPGRLRYRISDRKLYLGIKLNRIEDLMGKIVEDVISKIERGANISVLDGLPPT